MDKEQEWLIKNTIYLLNNNELSITPQDLAIKVLYILNGFNYVYNHDVVCKALNNSDQAFHLLKRAKGKLVQSFTLSFLFKVLHSNMLTVEQIFSMDVPEEFFDSIKDRRKYKKRRFKCLAPWCNREDHFIKTSHSQSNRKGSFKYYLICKGCGCRYGVSSEGEFVELAKFIGIYNYLISRQEKRINLMKVSADSGYTFGMLRKAVAYFASREVLLYENYKVEFKKEKLQSFLIALQNGETLKQISHWSLWNSYYEYLYYRYHKEVLALEMSKLKTERNNRKPSLKKDKLETVIIPILKQMFDNDEDVTIRNVCSKAGIGQSTLRLWQGNVLVESIKREQLMNRRKNLLNIIREAIEKYFAENANQYIYALNLYKSIGVRRSDLRRLSPEMASEITVRIRQHNELIKHQPN